MTFLLSFLIGFYGTVLLRIVRSTPSVKCVPPPPPGTWVRYDPKLFVYALEAR